jgi:O-antigen ligase
VGRPAIHKKIALGSLLMAVVAMPFSISLCHTGLILFLLNWVVSGAWDEKKKLLLDNPIAWLLPGFFILHLAGLIYTENLDNGWANLGKKIFLLLVPVAMASIPLFSKADLRKLLKAFTLACLIGTGVCLVNALSFSLESGTIHNFGNETMNSFRSFNPDASYRWMYFSYIGLSSGIGLHPTYFGLYLLFCLLVLVHFYSEGELNPLEMKIVPFLSFYFILFIIFLSSRIITIGMLLLAIAFIWRNYQKIKKLSVAVILLIFGLAFSFVYINPVSRYRNLQEASITKVAANNEPAGNSLSIRASLWQLSKKSFDAINPWIGTGTGDVNDLMFSMSERYQIKNILETYDPHNQFFQTLLGLGAIGLFTLLACFFAPIFIAYQRGFYLYVTFGSLFALTCLTESALEVQKGIVFFSLFSSLLFYHQKSFSFSPKLVVYG